LAHSRLFRDQGIEITALYVIGFPGETAASVRNSVAFNRRLRPYFTLWTPLFPMPSTVAGQWHEKNSTIHSFDFDNVSPWAFRPPEPMVSTPEFPVTERKAVHFFAFLETAQYRVRLGEWPEFFRLAREFGMTRLAWRSVARKFTVVAWRNALRPPVVKLLGSPGLAIDLARWQLGRWWGQLRRRRLVRNDA